MAAYIYHQGKQVTVGSRYVTQGGAPADDVPGSLSTANLATGSPTLGRPTLAGAGGGAGLGAPAFTHSAPTFTRPILGTQAGVTLLPRYVVSNGRDVTFGGKLVTYGTTETEPVTNNLTLPRIVLGVPDLGQRHTLAATPLTVGTPVTVFSLTLAAFSLSTGAVTYGSPTLGSSNGLLPRNFTLPAIAFQRPALATSSSGAELPAGLLVTAKGKYVQKIRTYLTADPIDPAAVPAAELSLVLPAPTFEAPALGQSHSLGKRDLTLGLVTFGRPFLGAVNVMAAIPMEVGAPTLERPVVGTFLGTPPVFAPIVLGKPVLGIVHALSVAARTVGTPTLGRPSIAARHGLTATPIQLGNPTLQRVAVRIPEVYFFQAEAIQTGGPILGRPFLAAAQTTPLVARPFATGPVTVLPPFAGQYHLHIAQDLEVGPPEFEQPVLVEKDPPPPVDRPAPHGTAILYKEATALERAMADTDVPRLMQLGAELVYDVWDAFRISKRNLPYLAWHMGVNLWEETWGESVQRDWVDRQWQFQAVRGTIRAQQMALGINGYDLVDYITPPEGFYASKDLDKEQMDEWVRRMPQIRIKLARRETEAFGDEWFADDGAVEVHASGIDDGEALHGRQAVIRYADGTEEPLWRTRYVTTEETRASVDFEQVSIPGAIGIGAFVADEDASDTDVFVGFAEVEPQVITVRLDRAYNHQTSDLHLSTVHPTQEPIDVTYERNSDTIDAGPCFYEGDFSDDFYACEGREAAEALADRLYLYDPAVAAPMMEGMSFADIDRVGVAPFTMELLVDLHMREELPAFFSDDASELDAYAVPEDHSHIDRALRAVVAAKAQRDKVAVTFEVYWPVTYGTVLKETTTFGERVRAHL